MELAKEIIGVRLYRGRRYAKKSKSKGFFENYRLFGFVVATTLTFTIINIILIIEFLEILANF